MGAPFWTARRALVLLALVLATALALFYLWQSWQWVYWLNRLHQAQTELGALQAENDYLKFELAQAFSLERIAQIATQKLGMIRPTLQYLLLPTLTP
jgi:cell division protein FtsL